jgi:hypothetical protein
VQLVVFTDTVVLSSLTLDVATTRAAIQTVANQLELRVDDVSESRGLVTTKLRVTLTGTGEQIDAFRGVLEGDGWTTGGGLIEQFVLNPLLGTAQRSLAKRWRKRAPRDWGPKPSAIPPSPSPSAGRDRTES